MTALSAMRAATGSRFNPWASLPLNTRPPGARSRHQPTITTMQIKFTDNHWSPDQVTLTISTREYALIHAGINSFLQLSRNPQSPGDRSNEGDIDLANALELQMFRAYCDREFSKSTPEEAK